MNHAERFWKKVEIEDVKECWNWQACKAGNGYGKFKIHGELWGAHRVSWVLTYGPVPEGLCVLHECDNPSCVNPYHLFLGTHTDNNADMMARRGKRWQAMASDGKRWQAMASDGKRWQDVERRGVG